MPPKGKKNSQSSEAVGEDGKQRKPKVLWGADGDIINDKPSSMDILLNWITTHGNYSRWKGSETHVGNIHLI